MNAVLLKTYKGFLNLLVTFLTKGRVSPSNFDQITQWCVAVEERKIAGTEKKKVVQDLTRALLPRVASFLVNVVIELSLSWAVRSGRVEKSFDVETTVLQ